MLVVLAKHFIDNLSEETKKGLQQKAEEGIWPLKPSIGYRSVTLLSGKRGMEIDPDVAPLIRRLLELYATGNYSLDEITQIARKDGFTTPRSKRPAHRAWIHKILTNRVYCGEFVWKGKVYLGIHEPIVSRELWNKVQAVLQGRNVSKPKQGKEKRKLLKFVLSNSQWKDGELMREFRQPFDLLADAAAAAATCAKQEAAGGTSDDLCQLMGG